MAASESSVITIPSTGSRGIELKDLIQTTPTAPLVTADWTLSCFANLVKLLPTGTVLVFQALAPSFTNKGICYTSNKALTYLLLALCSISCVFFSFTDSFVGRDGKLYYGIATHKGLHVFNGEEEEEEGEEKEEGPCGDLKKFRLRRLDFVHAAFSAVVFLTVSLSDGHVQSCFFPDAGRNTKQLLVNLPLGAAALSSLVFLIFPTTRKGIGYSDAAPNKQD